VILRALTVVQWVSTAREDEAPVPGLADCHTMGVPVRRSLKCYDNYYSDMRYRTVNVRPGTYERLKMYQIGGKSFSDVLDSLMETIEPDEFYKKAIRVHRRRMREVEKGNWLPVAELDKVVRGE